MKFKDTKNGDLTNKIYDSDIYVSNEVLNSLEGCPTKINGFFNCSHNLLTSLEYRPKLSQTFACRNNPELKNVKEQIIKYQIKSFIYHTDEGDFNFGDIRNEFEEFENKSKNLTKDIRNKDYGLSI